MKNQQRFQLKNLRRYNAWEKNNHKIAIASGISYPGVRKYLDGVPAFPVNPSLPHIAMLLDGMGADWQSITLGELLEEVEG